MLMNAVLAVALGLAPVNSHGLVNLARASSAEVASRLGHYKQSTDRRGTTRIEGRDVRGRSYELIMDKHGHVEASVGDSMILFDVAETA